MSQPRPKIPFADDPLLYLTVISGWSPDRPGGIAIGYALVADPLNVLTEMISGTAPNAAAPVTSPADAQIWVVGEKNTRDPARSRQYFDRRAISSPMRSGRIFSTNLRFGVIEVCCDERENGLVAFLRGASACDSTMYIAGHALTVACAAGMGSCILSRSQQLRVPRPGCGPCPGEGKNNAQNETCPGIYCRSGFLSTSFSATDAVNLPPGLQYRHQHRWGLVMIVVRTPSDARLEEVPGPQDPLLDDRGQTIATCWTVEEGPEHVPIPSGAAPL